MNFIWNGFEYNWNCQNVIYRMSRLVKLIWRVFTVGNMTTLARKCYVYELECRIGNAKVLSWTVYNGYLS